MTTRGHRSGPLVAGAAPVTAPKARRFPEGSVTDPVHCLLCRLDDAPDEAVVFRDGDWACEVAPGFEVPGWYFLRLRRHALGWSELAPPELATFGPVARDLMVALERAFDAPARYLMTFGEAYPHFHCVVTVRTDDIPLESRSGNILALRVSRADRAAALDRVPAVRAALNAVRDQGATDDDRPAPPGRTGTPMSHDTVPDSAHALTVDEERFTPTSDPQPPVNRATARPVVAPVLHHTTFTTLRLDEMVAWYEKVAGLLPVFWGERAAWLSNDAANHRIALLSPPGLQHPQDKGHTTGIHHTAFEYATFDQWLDNYIRLRDHGILPWLTLDHGITMSVYYQDPDGNGVEIQVDGFGDWADSKQWTNSGVEFATNPIGTHFDPEKLVAAREQGLTFQEIHERARAGEYLPEHIPESILLPDLS